jgi:CRP-like cAMP-binding protein
VDLEALRESWHKATEKDRPHDAVKALVQLEKLEPNEPRWSQRLGESYRRIGNNKEAVDAFVRAFERYFSRGFLPRAIAMAKLVTTLDAARGDLLEKSLPQGGGVPPPLPFGKPVVGGKPPPVLHHPPPIATKAAAPPPVPPAKAAAAKAPPPPPPPPPPSYRPPPLPEKLRLSKPAPLARAEDSTFDEIRFHDAPESSIEILSIEFEISEVVTIDVDDSDVEVLPAATRPPPEASTRQRNPDVDAYASLATMRLFSALSRDALVALSNAAELVEFVPGAMIIVRDERAFALYAIVSGTARVIVAGSPEIRLREGDIFGEASLLDEGKRQADVKAETQLMTLRIEKTKLDEVTKEYPELEDALFDLLARRLIMNLMHSSKLFSAFEPSGRLELAQKFEVRRATTGTVIMEQGRRSDGLYVLLAGHVVAQSDDGKPTRVARGTAFGHASFLGGSAKETIRTASEAVLLRMPAAGFAAMAALYPPVLAYLAETANDPLPVSKREP